ncbi:WxcM-like domain-containing protein [Alcanivorax sp.]|uniref:WxcM-like domain-containing protein n=1 Tax=Alcanivorax sp. TaxID=1872427 RepID=UPI002589C214|nr:WxcM-like domain-containing protein [Alcanivorax sp.]
MSFIHDKAICETKAVGKGTRVWAFAHILPGAVIGRDCNLCDGVFVENDVVIGDRVTVKCGVQLWDGLRIEDDVFIGPNVTFANDKHPRSRMYPEEFQKTIVCKGASIGANATILPGIVIGPDAMVGAGAVVTRNVPPRAVVRGNPARISGYMNSVKRDVLRPARVGCELGVGRVGVGDVELFPFKRISDMRGSLSVVEFGEDLPFHPARVFFVYDVPSIEVRGEHAHRICKQFLVCLKGSVRVLVDDGRQSRDVQLETPELGLYLPPMVWGVQHHFSDDALMMVLASHPYDADDYIRDYQLFLAEANNS